MSANKKQKEFLSRTLFVLLVTLSSCTSPQEKDFNLATKLSEEKKFPEAIKQFEYVIKRDPESPMAAMAAREGGRIAYFDAKKFEKAAYFYKHLVVHSASSEERIKSQKVVAEIYFDQLQDYGMAIIEFSKLLQMPHSDHELAEFKISIARAHYYLNNFFQAESEINELLRLKIDEEMRFRSQILLGDLLMAQKNYTRAIDLYKETIKNHPEKAVSENLAFAMAVCYEETDQFKEAIQALESIKDKYQPREYVELRIKRLNNRLKNQPGAKGFRK